MGGACQNHWPAATDAAAVTDLWTAYACPAAPQSSAARGGLAEASGTSPTATGVFRLSALYSTRPDRGVDGPVARSQPEAVFHGRLGQSTRQVSQPPTPTPPPPDARRGLKSHIPLLWPTRRPWAPTASTRLIGGGNWRPSPLSHARGRLGSWPAARWLSPRHSAGGTPCSREA